MSTRRRIMAIKNDIKSIPLFYFPLNEDNGCFLNGVHSDENDIIITDNGVSSSLKDGVPCTYFEYGYGHARYIEFKNAFKEAFNFVCGSNPRSVSVWFNRGYGQIYLRQAPSLVSWGNTSSGRYASLEVNENSNRISFHGWYYSSDIKEETEISPISVPVNGWCHAVGTATETAEFISYFNGQPNFHGRYRLINTTNTNKICIANRMNDIIHPFNGYLADLRIYDRVLTAKEIMQIYNKGINIF